MLLGTQLLIEPQTPTRMIRSCDRVFLSLVRTMNHTVIPMVIIVIGTLRTPTVIPRARLAFLSVILKGRNLLHIHTAFADFFIHRATYQRRPSDTQPDTSQATCDTYCNTPTSSCHPRTPSDTSTDVRVYGTPIRTANTQASLFLILFSSFTTRHPSSELCRVEDTAVPPHFTQTLPITYASAVHGASNFCQHSIHCQRAFTIASHPKCEGIHKARRSNPLAAGNTADKYHPSLSSCPDTRLWLPSIASERGTSDTSSHNAKGHS